MALSVMQKAVPLKFFVEHVDSFVCPVNTLSFSWAPEKAAKFLDTLLRGGGGPQIVLRELKGTVPQKFEILEGAEYLVAITDFLDDKLRIPSTLKDLRLYKHHTSVDVGDGRLMFGEFFFLPLSAQKKVLKMPYPVRFINQ